VLQLTSANTRWKERASALPAGSGRAEHSGSSANSPEGAIFSDCNKNRYTRRSAASACAAVRRDTNRSSPHLGRDEA
jgi:hypothetical protein